MATPDEVHEHLDTTLTDLIEGYTLTEVLERFAVVVRRIPKESDVVCPSGTVFSQSAFHDQVADELERLAV